MLTSAKSALGYGYIRFTDLLKLREILFVTVVRIPNLMDLQEMPQSTLLDLIIFAHELSPGACWVGPPKMVKDTRTKAPHHQLPLVRFLYPILVAPIPDNQALQNWCGNPKCRNPHHFRVSRRANAPRIARKKDKRYRDHDWAMGPMGMIEGAIEVLTQQNPEIKPSPDNIITSLAEIGVTVTYEDIAAYNKEYGSD
jgi:hypothetical protein